MLFNIWVKDKHTGDIHQGGKMTVAKALSIFMDINNEKYTEREKARAIRRVLKMPTHNSITKDSMLKVIEWQWHKMYEL